MGRACQRADPARRDSWQAGTAASAVGHCKVHTWRHLPSGQVVRPLRMTCLWQVRRRSTLRSVLSACSLLLARSLQSTHSSPRRAGVLGRRRARARRPALHRCRSSDWALGRGQQSRQTAAAPQTPEPKTLQARRLSPAEARQEMAHLGAALGGGWLSHQAAAKAASAPGQWRELVVRAACSRLAARRRADLVPGGLPRRWPPAGGAPACSAAAGGPAAGAAQQTVPGRPAASTGSGRPCMTHYERVGQAKEASAGTGVGALRLRAGSVISCSLLRVPDTLSAAVCWLFTASQSAVPAQAQRRARSSCPQGLQITLLRLQGTTVDAGFASSTVSPIPAGDPSSMRAGGLPGSCLAGLSCSFPGHTNATVQEPEADWPGCRAAVRGTA